MLFAMRQLAWATSAFTVPLRSSPLRTGPRFGIQRCLCARAALPISDDARRRNVDPNAVAVVVGASRGIGLAMVQSLVTRWKGPIVATCRDVDAAGALSALWQFMPDRFSVLPMDVCDEASIEKVAETVRAIGEEPRVDLLIHCAGILHEGTNMPETSISRLNADFMRRTIEVNLMGPVLVAKHLAPLMTTARKKERVPSVLAALSARVGSISDNRLGGWLSYRASKAGQNQAMRTMSIELGRRGVICVSLHPGTVNTELSAPFQKRVPPGQLQDVDVAAGRLLDVVDSLSTEDNGSFMAYDGTSIVY